MLQTITSSQNDLIKYLVKLRINRDFRYDHSRVIIEGKKCIEEIAKTQPILRLLSTHENLPGTVQAKDSYLVPEHLIQKILGMEHSEGIIAEIEMPKFKPFSTSSRILVLEEIQDPGNLGTLIRTALAFGWESIFLIGNCCDPYNDKALRAAKGATFRISLSKGSREQFIDYISKNNNEKTHILAADLSGDVVTSIPNSDSCMLILGNEAHGISREAKAIAKSVTIPMQGPMESLNVSIAGAILMHQLQLQPNTGSKS